MGIVEKQSKAVYNLPDVLKVKTQSKHYANDKEGSEKLIATTKDIGQTLEANTFGKCKKQPMGSDYKPCQAVITEWKDFYEKVTLSNQGKILLEDSKATCPIGGPDCIEITKHGQKAEVSKQNVKKANPVVHSQLNPLVDMSEFQEEEEPYYK